MVNNGLKLNQDKTELVFISSKFRSRPSLEFIQVSGEKIQPKSSARNLGGIIDQCLDLRWLTTAFPRLSSARYDSLPHVSIRCACRDDASNLKK